MEINMNDLVNQMRSMAAQAADKPNNELTLSGASEVGFSTQFQEAISHVNELANNSKQLKIDYQLGKTGVELADVMIAGQKASIAFDAMVQVRNKFVDAYKEVMNMPV